MSYNFFPNLEFRFLVFLIISKLEFQFGTHFHFAFIRSDFS